VVDGRTPFLRLYYLCFDVSLSPDASDLSAQTRVLADLAQTFLVIADQLQGVVWVMGKHRISP
jgi:hypothetical protein